MGTEKYITRLLYASYVVMLALSLTIFAVGIFLGSFVDVIIAVPVIFALIDALFVERTVIHIPPLMIFLMVGLMILILIGGMIEDGYLFNLIIDLLFGFLMGLGGLIIAHSLFRTIPGIAKRKPFLTAFVSMSLALTLLIIIVVLEYVMCILAGTEIQTMKELMEIIIMVIVGSLIVTVTFYFTESSGLIQRTVTNYFEIRMGTLETDEYEIMEIEKALKGGESEKVEFKSTLRTNLATGEKDVRIEKSVLKTIVAFLNSRGGTLLIGIADDGSVVGIDEQSFDNRDKLNLHLTNLIASQIGNEFLPYISFRLSDYKGKGVMRVVCVKSDSPVFLKEGKQETFYVRSGPSSVDLHGMDTLNYVDNRFKKQRKKRFLE